MNRRHKLLLTLVSVLVMIANPALAAADPHENGAFIRTPDGRIYRIVGGAPIHVNSCEPLEGCPGVTQVPNLEGYPATPVNGSFVRIANGPYEGLVARAAGETFIGVGTCEPLGGCPWVNIDQSGYEDYQRAHPVVANGTFVRVASGPANGLVTRAVGGALLGVGTCEPLGGCSEAVNVDQLGFEVYEDSHPVPANGAFVEIANGPQVGQIARAAGGALLPISNCVFLDGCPNPVRLDEYGYRSYVSGHQAPSNGTLLLGFPSNTTWVIQNDHREMAPVNSAAVAVDDTTLETFALTPTTETSGLGSSVPTKPAPSVSPSPVPRVLTVGSFKMYYAGLTTPGQGDRLRLTRIVVIGTAMGEHVVAVCSKCTGQARFGRTVAKGNEVEFKPLHVTVTGRSAVSIDVTSPGKDGRFKVYAIRVRTASASVHEEGCLAPGSTKHIDCPR